MAAYSQDLRDRVLRALARNDGPTEIARRFEISVRWVYEVKERYELSGERCSRPVGGYRRSCVADKESQIKAWIKACQAQVEMSSSSPSRHVWFR